MNYSIFLLFLLVSTQHISVTGTGLLHSHFLGDWDSKLCNQLGFYKNQEEVLRACNQQITDLRTKLQKEYADLEKKKQEILRKVQTEAEKNRKEQEIEEANERNKRLQIQLQKEKEEAEKRREAQLKKEEEEINQRYMEQLKREQDDAHARKLYQIELEYAQQRYLDGEKPDDLNDEEQ